MALPSAQKGEWQCTAVIMGCRITDQIIMDGNKAVVMENQKLRLTFLADRGMDCVEMLYKPEDIDFMWRSPAGLHKRSEYLSNSGDSLGELPGP